MTPARTRKHAGREEACSNCASETLTPRKFIAQKNVDHVYAKSFVDDMFEVAKLMGPNVTLVLSNDDKANRRVAACFAGTLNNHHSLH